MRSFMCRMLCFVLSSCAWGSSGQGMDAAINPQVLDELLNEAVPSWQSLEDELDSYDITYRCEFKQGPIGNLELLSDLTFRVAVDSGRHLAMRRTQSVNAPDRIGHSLLNGDYDFNVFAQDPRSKGKLTYLRTNPPNQTTDQAAPSWSQASDSEVLVACRVGVVQLHQLLQEPNFKLIDAMRMATAGHEEIRFAVESLVDQNNGWTRGSVCTITVDPSHQYRVMERIFSNSGSPPSSLRVVYPDGTTTPFPRQVVFSMQSGDELMEQSFTYEPKRKFEIAVEEFYLPHYGISEAVLETLNPNPWPRWLLIGFGIVTIAIGAWLVRGRRQPAA